jgi:nucleotide-binding universal stress UspA family protein
VYRKIVIGYDGGNAAEDALALAQVIGPDTQLVLTGVFPQGPFVDHQQDPAFTRTIESAAERVGARADTRTSTSPAHGIHDAAAQYSADLIVVGSSHGAEPRRMVAGEVGAQLLQGAPCAVTVAPAGWRHHGVILEKIGVALDGGGESREALHAAVELARATGAELRLVTVAASGASAFGWGYGVFAVETGMQDAYESHLREASRLVPDDVAVTSEVLAGGPVWDVLGRESEHVDLLCIGSRGYGPVRRVLVGSVSAELMEHAGCPVLVVPRGIAGAPAAAPGHAVAEPAW